MHKHDDDGRTDAPIPLHEPPRTILLDELHEPPRTLLDFHELPRTLLVDDRQEIARALAALVADAAFLDDIAEQLACHRSGGIVRVDVFMVRPSSAARSPSGLILRCEDSTLLRLRIGSPSSRTSAVTCDDRGRSPEHPPSPAATAAAASSASSSTSARRGERSDERSRGRTRPGGK